jgi:hypothetical protein
VASLCIELHYIIHLYFTPIKQRGQGRDSTFSLGLNLPPSSVNHKRLWALHSKALRPRKNELNILALLSSLSLTLLSHSPCSSSSSSLSKFFRRHLLLRSPYVKPRQCCRGHRQPSDTCTWDTSRRCPMSPPRPGTNWADWSDAMGREMYLRRALDRLNFEYPSDDAS